MKYTVSFVVSALVLLSACGSRETTAVEYDSGQLTFILEAPMFEGPNTVSAEIPLDLAEIFALAGANREKIKSVALESLLFHTVSEESDSIATFNAIENMTVQLFSDAHDLTVLSNFAVERDLSVLEAAVSTDVNVASYFSEPYIFLVIDMNVSEPDSIPLVFTTRLKAKITAEKK
jgi:hypothetical protein